MLSFLTYGVVDGVTAVYMMEKRGTMSEINPVVRYTYVYSGGLGVIAIKMLYAFIILFFVWRLSKGKNTYWTVNGFLFALFIGSILVMRANLMTANGMIPQSSVSIIFTFLFVSMLFLYVGKQIDKFYSSRAE